MNDVELFEYTDDTLLGWIAWITLFANPWGFTNDLDDWKATVATELQREGIDPFMNVKDFLEQIKR